MNNNKFLIYLMVVLLITGIGISSIFFVLSLPKSASALEKITVAEFGEVFIYAPLYVAEEKGFFREAGLDVKIVPTGGDDKTFAALLSGNAQFGVADPTFAAISGEKGQKGLVIASVLSGVPFWGVAKRNSVPAINKADDLKNFSVATFPAPSTAYSLQKQMFESVGLNANIKETAFGSLLAALETDQVDIALELEPNVSTAVQNGDRIVYSMADSYPDFAITGLTVLPDYLNNHEVEAQKMVSALAKAMKYIRSNPDETAQILAKRFPEVKLSIAKEAVQNMIRANVFPKSPMMTKKAWDNSIQLRKNVGDLNGSASYSEYVDMSFVEKIQQ